MILVDNNSRMYKRMKRSGARIEMLFTIFCNEILEY